jgi:4-carboxymuconolactone decarboxylase
MSKFENGMKVRREVLGDAHVDRSLKNANAFDQDFQQHITETVWGSVWTRDGLERHSRHLVTIAILAALGREHELELHVRSTINTGVTPEQLREVLMHVAAYAGVPAANSAFAIAKRILTEQGRLEDGAA